MTTGTRKVLFAAFLGYNPIKTLLGPKVLAGVSPANQGALTGRSFFPHLISAPFSAGLHEAFAFAVACCLLAALASALRGKNPVMGATPPSSLLPPERRPPRRRAELPAGVHARS